MSASALAFEKFVLRGSNETVLLTRAGHRNCVLLLIELDHWISIQQREVGRVVPSSDAAVHECHRAERVPRQDGTGPDATGMPGPTDEDNYVYSDDEGDDI